MPRATRAKRAKVRAKEAIVVTVGAAPVEWHKRIVRDRHTGQLREVDVHELGPKKEAVDGIPYAFERNEEVEADHPAVADCPGGFVPVEDD